MQSQVETLSPVLVQIKVEVPWQKVNEDLESAYRTTQRTAKIRGFRLGKVPRDVVKNVLGKSIRSEVTSELIRQGIGHAVEEHSLEPVSYQDLSPAAITAFRSPDRPTMSPACNPVSDASSTTVLPRRIRSMDARSNCFVNSPTVRLTALPSVTSNARATTGTKGVM